MRELGPGGGDVRWAIEPAEEGVRLRDIAEIARRDIAEIARREIARHGARATPSGAGRACARAFAPSTKLSSSAAAFSSSASPEIVPRLSAPVVPTAPPPGALRTA